MIDRISASSRPALKSFTGGRRRPSCSTSVAFAEKPPGTMPPTSGQWPVFASQHQSAAAVEERLDELHVHQVRAAEVRIVHDEDVALRERDLLVAHPVDHRLGGELHRADEHRQAELALRDQLARLAVVDAVGAVERFRDHRAERGAHEREVHLVADLLQAVLDHREGDRVERGVDRRGAGVVRRHGGRILPRQTVTMRLPSASCSTRQPGSISVVQSSCSITAGPANAPARAASRGGRPGSRASPLRTTPCGVRSPLRRATAAARAAPARRAAPGGDVRSPRCAG